MCYGAFSKHLFLTFPYSAVLSSTQPTNAADPNLKKQPKTSLPPQHFLIVVLPQHCCFLDTLHLKDINTQNSIGWWAKDGFPQKDA
jgi:hypothetical protein